MNPSYQEREPDYQEKILESRAAGFSDEDIFNKMKQIPQFAEKYKASEASGISSNETDKYLKDKYKLNVKPPKTLFQSAISALTFNPVAYGIEKIAGRNPISENIQEAHTGLATGGAAGILSLPHELARFPEKTLESIQQYHGGENPRFFEEGNVGLRSVVEPILQGANWLSEKSGLKEATKNLYSFEEATQLLRGDKELQTHAGKAGERIGAGLATAGPVGAFIGGADYLAEQAGLSPEQRGVMALMIGKAQKGQKAIKPSEIISNTHDLAAKMIAYNPDDINIGTLKAAYDLNIPVEDIPMQALYKNGLPNLVEGISQNSLMGSGKFNNLLENFTGELTNKIQGIIDSMPIDTPMEIISTTEHLGEHQFNNFLPEVFEKAAPQLEIPKHETGKIGMNALQKYDADITSQYKALYDQVSFTEKDVINPLSADYTDLQKTVNSVEKKLTSKGFKGAERKEALTVIKELKDLFNSEKSTDLITGVKIKKSPIKLEDIRKNIQDLNKKISYENPTLVNLLEPVASKMRNVMEVAASNADNLKPLIQANKLFREKSQFFQDPLIEKMLKMTDEKFYNTVRNNPSMLKKFSDFANATGQTVALNNLKGQIMADVLEKPLKASNIKEFVNSINDKVIKETRELEPLYPELKGLSKSLQDSKKMAAHYLKPEEQFKSKIRQKILEDIMSDSEFTYTLDLMNSPRGIRLVKDTLSHTKQGKEILKTLEHKKVEQALYNGPKKQEINLVELGEVFDNPKTDSILKTLLIPQNYAQAKSVSLLAKQYQKGLRTHGKLKNKFESGVGIGILPALFIAPVKTTIGIGTVAYYLTSKNFKKALIDNAKKQYDLKVNTDKKQAKTNHNKT